MSIRFVWVYLVLIFGVAVFADDAQAGIMTCTIATDGLSLTGSPSATPMNGTVDGSVQCTTSLLSMVTPQMVGCYSAFTGSGQVAPFRTMKQIGGGDELEYQLRFGGSSDGPIVSVNASTRSIWLSSNFTFTFTMNYKLFYVEIPSGQYVSPRLHRRCHSKPQLCLWRSLGCLWHSFANEMRKRHGNRAVQNYSACRIKLQSQRCERSGFRPACGNQRGCQGARFDQCALHEVNPLQHQAWKQGSKRSTFHDDRFRPRCRQGPNTLRTLPGFVLQHDLGCREVSSFWRRQWRRTVDPSLWSGAQASTVVPARHLYGHRPRHTRVLECFFAQVDEAGACRNVIHPLPR